MEMKIAIAGSTGTVGRQTVKEARKRGHEVVEISRSAGIDVTELGGLAEALAGVDAVIDVTGPSSASVAKAIEFFQKSSSNLLQAGKQAGVRHHVTLSIVGIDKIASGYYAAKLAQEEVVEKSDVPWSILRATQFHEFASQMVGQLSFGPFAMVPKARTQPIAAAEVGRALIDLAEKGPGGRVADLAGPRVEDLGKMARGYLRAVNSRKKVFAATLPGKFFKGLRDGLILPEPGATLGEQTYAEWLEALPAGGNGQGQ